MATSVSCPQCGSAQITAQKKGFSGTKAVAGAVLVGGVGLLAGLHGSSDVDVSCLNCGHHWNPKQLTEQRQREVSKQQMTELENWKRAFYAAYEQQDYARALALYMEKHPFLKETPDVHFVYKEEKKSERFLNLLMAGFIALLVLLFIWFLS